MGVKIAKTSSVPKVLKEWQQVLARIPIAAIRLQV
jgi:hypothetical protein